jgi:hypothetical protein
MGLQEQAAVPCQRELLLLVVCSTEAQLARGQQGQGQQGQGQQGQGQQEQIRER